MLVMLSCGPSSGKIIKTVSTQIDNIDFHSFQNVGEFIHQCQLRHLAFDRLVFTSKFVSTEKDMSTLCDFVRSDLGGVEIVMILPKSQQNLEGIFKEYFDSPTYTVMYVDNPTTKCIVDAVNLPIIDVKARYYNLDKPKEGKDEKNSKFGFFKGGKKNKDENKKNKNSGNDVALTDKSTSESKMTNGDDEDLKNDGNGVGKLDTDQYDVEGQNSDNSDSSEFGFDGFTPLGDKNDSIENPDSSDDDMNLAIGDYGMMHSDSGFIGDDDLSELEEFARKHNTGSPSNSAANVVPPKSDRQKVSNEVSKSDKILDKNTQMGSGQGSLINKKPNKGNSKVTVVTGLRGSEATITVVNRAVDMAERGKRVLIIDLDNLLSGVLSFIDTEAYYLRGCFNGLVTKKVYSEDGVDILSNGYDNKISADSVDKLLSSSIVNNYDVILIDCPLDCLSLIEDVKFTSYNIEVCCIPDLSKLLETSMMLSNRAFVSLAKDIKINREGSFASGNIATSDIEVVKDSVVFANGCWLD